MVGIPAYKRSVNMVLQHYAPFPHLNGDDLAYKCDYCGGDPACVKECEPGALVFQKEDKEMRRLRGRQIKQRSDASGAEARQHQLGLNILAAARK